MSPDGGGYEEPSIPVESAVFVFSGGGGYEELPDPGYNKALVFGNDEGGYNADDVGGCECVFSCSGE